MLRLELDVQRTVGRINILKSNDCSERERGAGAGLWVGEKFSHETRVGNVFAL
jgi:hypothetical protein